MIKVGQLYRQGLEGQLKKGLDKKDNIFILKYSKVSSSAMNDLRKELKRKGAKMLVVRNTIARKTLKDIKLEGIAGLIDGPIAIVYSDSDAVNISKTLAKFVKEHEASQLQGGVLQQSILSAEDVKRLASLPAREVLLSMLLSAIQSPLSSLAYVLSAKTRELLYALKQIADKKKE